MFVTEENDGLHVSQATPNSLLPVYGPWNPNGNKHFFLVEASQSNPPTYPFLPLYYLMLGQLVALTFLFVSKRKGWGLFWCQYITSLSVVAIGYILGGMMHSSQYIASSSDDPIAMLFFTVFSCFLIQFFLFHLIAGLMLLGVITVAISVWFVRGIKSLKSGRPHLQLNALESNESHDSVSDLRYVAFLCALLAITVLNIFVTHKLLTR